MQKCPHYFFFFFFATGSRRHSGTREGTSALLPRLLPPSASDRERSRPRLWRRVDPGPESVEMWGLAAFPFWPFRCLHHLPPSFNKLLLLWLYFMYIF
jgi:hypothetical protein